jgi:hypothetical protein
MGCTPGSDQGQADERKQESQVAKQERGKDLAPVTAMEAGTGGELGLVLRLEALLAIPPSTAAVEITAYFRGADEGGHGRSGNGDGIPY